jgi:site-specific recombinase XerD
MWGERKYIHNYEGQYTSCKKRLNALKISKRNKELILKLKYYDILMNISLNYTRKNFDKLTKEDYEKIVAKLEHREDITVSTKQKYKVIMKKFGRWLAYGDKIFMDGLKKYPEGVSWINTTIKSKNMPRIRASDILTEEEVDRLIEATEHPKNKAFLSILYETGSRSK